MKNERLLLTLYLILFFFLPSKSADMKNYCYVPPFIGTNVPPLVMLVMGRDHKLYYEAYNDASDLDEDGKLDVGYKHSIDYYGYFDPYKCYVYDGSGANAKFIPTKKTTNKYCGGDNEWSGNFLNWLTMSRMDVLRKVLYGGYRSSDSSSETVLEATYIPQDAHSWGKEYNGTDTRNLTPFNLPSSGNRHLFCITSTSEGETRKIRVLTNKSNRIWEWASKERPVCDTSLGNPTDYYIRVKVCDSNIGLESNCKKYPSGGGVYKPVGLLQKYGDSDGSKVCSKSLKSCNTDADCNPVSSNGLCIDKARMYFGLLTGSYTKNLSGGVLRKNIWSFSDEINQQTGIFQTSENVEGNIVITLDRMKVVGFRYSDYSYQDASGGSCGWITDHPLSEGECRMWGNPIAEMMYEALRYLAGKSSPTSSFTYSGNQDSGLNLSKPDWGIKKGNDTYKTFDLFPICAKPFMLVLSDINNSYDSDSVPGSSFNSFSGDLTNLNVSSLADIISSTENISGSYFIGQSGSLIDYICSAKSMSSLKNVRGLCPEEPTKQGSFYPASVAYYGNKLNNGWRDNFSVQKPSSLKTFSVTLASPVPDIAVKVGNSIVRIVPMAKSLSGCLGVKTACWDKCTITKDSNGNVKITNCQANSFCPTNQIVDFYVDTVNYDSNNNITYAKFRINFEDVEQGADHDMDAIVEYEIQPVGSNQIKIKLNSTYAAGCIDQVLGFNISGTTEDGAWLVVKDKDASSSDGDTPQFIVNLPLTWEKTFTVSGNAAGQLKPPLWYAAKWGGFDDINNNDIPDLQSEWDKDGDGKPDTYFYIVNPLKMESELEKAFSEILKRASSGSTVATLSTKTQISSMLVQPYFYPTYTDSTGRTVSWIGFLRSFWVDPKNDLREDTNSNKVLDLSADKIFQTYFDTNANQTKAALMDDSSTCNATAYKDINSLIPVFNSGCWLATCNPSDRKIYYNSGTSLTEFTTSNYSTLQSIWDYVDDGNNNGTIDQTKSQCIIRYLRGEDLSNDNTCKTISYVTRNINVNIKDFGCSQTDNIKKWKLGDIVYSTPSVVGNEPLRTYHLKYGDNTYYQYISDDGYKNRRSLLMVGANDGMLHFFRMGTIIDQSETYPGNPVKVQNSPTDTGTDKIGIEEFALIPRYAIPYLLWYGSQDYCHVPTIDNRTFVFDASIGGSPTDTKTKDSWRTILVGVMGFGGKAITIGNETYSSSIYVLDLTDYLNGTSNTPTVLWEKPLPDNTLTLSFPSVIRMGNSNQNGEWYVVIGSGPNVPAPKSDSNFRSNPKLYIFNLKDGTLAKTLAINLPNNTVAINLPNNTVAAVGDSMPIDVDYDYQDDTVYFGLYGLQKQGNSWNNWGNFYRLVIKNKSISDLQNSDIQVAVDMDNFKNSDHTPPITAAPTFTKDEKGNLWVFFGTGRYLTADDKTLGYKNYFIGFKDPCWNGSCTTTFLKSDFTDTTAENVHATVKEIKPICICDSSGCGNKNVVYYASGNEPAEVATGWYKELTNEAVISQATLFGSIVDFLTFVPPNDICAFEGNTNLYALYYKSGTAYPNPAILSPSAVTGTIAVGQTVTVKPKIELGTGIPPRGNPFQINVSQNNPNQYEKFIQLSSGVVLRQKQQPVPQSKGRFILWIEK